MSEEILRIYIGNETEEIRTKSDERARQGWATYSSTYGQSADKNVIEILRESPNITVVLQGASADLCIASATACALSNNDRVIIPLPEIRLDNWDQSSGGRDQYYARAIELASSLKDLEVDLSDPSILERLTVTPRDVWLKAVNAVET